MLKQESHQPERVVPDFVNPEVSGGAFFSARLFWVTVRSDFSGFSCALKALFIR
jgi:hypothetical protein